MVCRAEVDEAALVTPAWEARQPCLAFHVNGPAGTSPPTQAGLELSRKGVLVMALGPNPDGDGILLRLWEQVGEDSPCTVRRQRDYTGTRPAM